MKHRANNVTELPDPDDDSERRRLAEIGRKVQAGLARGRARAQARSAEVREQTDKVVRDALDRDIIAGHRPWGRAERIARRVGLHPATVRKSLKRLSRPLDSGE